jgi:hypothetical protein
MLSEGRWTHDFPISAQAAQELGFPVTTDMPRRVYELMDLCHQAHPRRPSVIYVPMRGIGPAKGDTETPKLVPQGDSRWQMQDACVTANASEQSVIAGIPLF